MKAVQIMKHFYLLLIIGMAMLFAIGCGQRNDTEQISESTEWFSREEQNWLENLSGQQDVLNDFSEDEKNLQLLLKKGDIELNQVTGDNLIVVLASDTGIEMNCFNKNDGHQWILDDELRHIPAFVGYNGVGDKQVEGDGITPLGLWDIDYAFGFYNNPGTHVVYQQITENSYWVDDPNSSVYNRWVEGTDNRDWVSAEHLIEFPAYHYALVIKYNYDIPIQGAGSAIFLHCGETATAGCIAISEEEMIKLLQWVQPGTQILIARN